MSCWVTPSVAAEYWGVTVDVVWDRINGRMVPHKSEDGFIFVDVDPWTPVFTGRVIHPVPPTYIPAGEVELAGPVISGTLLSQLDPEEEVFLSSDELSKEEEDSFGRDLDEEMGNEGGLEEAAEDEELPGLDEEESATFGRLSWEEVRQSVGRTRRPPPRAA